MRIAIAIPFIMAACLALIGITKYTVDDTKTRYNAIEAKVRK